MRRTARCVFGWALTAYSGGMAASLLEQGYLAAEQVSSRALDHQNDERSPAVCCLPISRRLASSPCVFVAVARGEKIGEALRAVNGLCRTPRSLSEYHLMR
jgi:hypothetical protein